MLAGGIACLGLASGWAWRPALATSMLALPFVYIAIILSWTSYRLGPKGDDVQARIHQLLIDAVGRSGRLLDVGCGSGQLLIRAARSEPGEYVGLDDWGSDWEYSCAQAKKNAAIENVHGIEFLKGSASKLPFRDAEFSRIVSSLTFHEVQDVSDRTACLCEAMRVLEPGGRFAFVDLFDDPKLYDGRQNVLDAIANHGGRVDTADSLTQFVELRFPLSLPKALKYAVLINGMKLPVTGQQARSAEL